VAGLRYLKRRISTFRRRGQHGSDQPLFDTVDASSSVDVSDSAGKTVTCGGPMHAGDAWPKN